MNLNLINRVSKFWFPDLSFTPANIERLQKLWFFESRKYDEIIRTQFGQDTEDALSGKHDDLGKSPEGSLSLIVVLDQFTRQAYRGTAKAFSGDEKALKLAKSALSAGFDQQVHPLKRMFMYLPFEHSESIQDQETSIACAKKLVQDLPEPLQAVLKFAEKHRDIIKAYGRYPHRNDILGRVSTPEELVYLKNDYPKFG